MKIHDNIRTAILDALVRIFAENKYADKVIERTLKSNPKWGSRDRRLIAESVYDIVRWYRLLKEAAGTDDMEKIFFAYCLWKGYEKSDSVSFGSFQAVRSIRESIPDWLDELGVKELGEEKWEKEIHALNEEAKVVLRANTLKPSRDTLRSRLSEKGIGTSVPGNFPDALVLEKRQNVFSLPEFKEGLFEVQDASSQLVAPFLDVKEGMRVVDACAGAGGKTLHLAALMHNKGRIIALDTEQWKLDELRKRARRAGAGNIETRVIDSSKVIKRLEGLADRLLLDAPCSGLGVLRRNPDAKWKLSEKFIEDVRVLQRKILVDYCTMLKRGGIMVYVTCSILPSENEKQVEWFLTSRSTEFELLEQRTIDPSGGFDGFFMAKLARRS